MEEHAVYGEKKEMTVVKPQEVEAWQPSQVMDQVRAIQQLMSEGMREGEHFGIIPGTNGKPTLLKPGAEKLCLMFRLAPRFEVSDKDLGGGHKEVSVKCSLMHINTGKFWGEGLGSCSTMESKYRYRKGEGLSTGVKVPKEYWDYKRQGNLSKMREIIGEGYTTIKVDGVWFIAEKGSKVENPDIADQYNTVLKMALKRSLVSATLSATAASDIFTQDLEEMVQAPEVLPPQTELPPKEEPKEPLITHSEQLEVFRMLKEKNVSQLALKKFLTNKLGVEGTAKIRQADYNTVLEWIIRTSDVIDGEVGK